jgi:hypothetical protein
MLRVSGHLFHVSVSHDRKKAEKNSPVERLGRRKPSRRMRRAMTAQGLRRWPCIST